MNVVGVGNLKFSTAMGMLISFCCGICGILFTGLPIPIIVDKFTVYLYGENRRLKVLNGFRSLQQNKLEGGPQNIKMLTKILKSNSRFVKTIGITVCKPTSHFSQHWKLSKSARPSLIVGGCTYDLTWDMFNRTPNTRLSQIGCVKSMESLLALCNDYSVDVYKTKFFFHRDSRACASILNFYFTGKFHVLDENICPNEFEAEIKYWMID